MLTDASRELSRTFGNSILPHPSYEHIKAVQHAFFSQMVDELDINN